jgi:RND family efflux transporter MFP subunit
MNMHLPQQDLSTRADLTSDAPAANRAGWLSRLPLNRLALAGLVLAALAGFVWFLVNRANERGPVAPPSGPPAVSVMVPGLVSVSERVEVTGTVQPKRDMPVGVVGEGGAISAIRAEAGQYVRAGQVLAEIDAGVQRAQLAQLQASVEQARADARLAQAELDRALKLVDRGFISQADIDRRTATRDSALARVRVADAQVREMQERIARLSIRAPEAGLVLERNVEPGQVVSPASGALFRVAAGGALELRGEVAEQDLAALRVGEPASVTLSGRVEPVSGSIWLLEPVVDPQRRLGTARIALARDPDVRVGGFATAAIVSGTAMRPRVPQSAVLADPAGSYVLVVGTDNKVARRDVKVAGVSRDGVAIREGLEGTERVVVSAGAFLRVGETVAPKPVKG